MNKIDKTQKCIPSFSSAPLDFGLKQLETLCEYIDYACKQENEYRLAIAKALSYIKNHKLFRYAGYTSFSDFVKDRFHYGRTNFFNYIKVCKVFGDHDPQTGDCIGIQPEYEPYSISQLIAMCNLPKELLKQVHPEMSVRAIQRLSQQRKKPAAPKEKAKKKRIHRKQLKGVDMSMENLPEEFLEPVTQAIRQINEQYPNAAIKGITASIQYELKGEDTHEET